jgi:homoserine dehydrogenase
MDDLERFRQEVDAYIAEAKLTPTAFGRVAINDPNFVFNLRTGREPRRDTIARVRSFMRGEQRDAA